MVHRPAAAHVPVSNTRESASVIFTFGCSVVAHEGVVEGGGTQGLFVVSLAFRSFIIDTRISDETEIV